MGHETSFQSSVVVPLVDYEGEECVLFEKRSLRLDHQPGEICFPGGRRESGDPGAASTAVRETCEELSLSPEDIELIAPLDILVSPFNAIIHPYLGRIKEFSRVKPSRDEVEYIFCVPLSFFLDREPVFHHLKVQLAVPTDYPFDLIPDGKNYPFREGSYPQCFYLWGQEVIWGLTARIMYHFVSLLKGEQGI
jgi:8-oxo-dGTP pyrophosphatase MutT (NUDIX family)